MSEFPTCPYCGSSVSLDRGVQYDEKVRITCTNCGGTFEYLPGFGAFSLPQDEHRKSRPIAREIPVRRDRERDEFFVEDSGDSSGCGRCCCGICALILFLNFAGFLISLFFRILF